MSNFMISRSQAGTPSFLDKAIKKAVPIMATAFFYILMICISYILNFFLPNPAKTTSPAPNKSKVVGSGMAILLVVFAEKA